MTSPLRRFVLAAGVAAFLSSQAAYAAPTTSFDPLVSLSVLGSDQSLAAVCAGSSAATAAAAAVAQAPGGCVLPVTAPPPAVAEGAPPPPMTEAGAPKAIGTLPLLLGLAALIGVAVLIISSNHDHNGNLTPVSPA